MRIIHEKHKCIGCGACISACPDFFEMDETGKATLKIKEAELDKGNEVEVAIVEEPGCARAAVEVCPVQCIRIEKD